MDLSFLPAVNATLNGFACVCLMTGLAMIKRRRIEAHRRCMLSATVLTGLFLVCYVTHYIWRAMEKGGLHTKYNGLGLDRTLYYTVLLSHIVLAVSVPPLAVWLIRLAMTGRFEQHRRLAKIALPIWMYVSVTGLMIYFMLYWLNPTL